MTVTRSFLYLPIGGSFAFYGISLDYAGQDNVRLVKKVAMLAMVLRGLSLAFN